MTETAEGGLGGRLSFAPGLLNLCSTTLSRACYPGYIGLSPPGSTHKPPSTPQYVPSSAAPTRPRTRRPQPLLRPTPLPSSAKSWPLRIPSRCVRLTPTGLARRAHARLLGHRPLSRITLSPSSPRLGVHTANAPSSSLLPSSRT